MEALKALSTFFVDNSLRSRRNLRGDIEKRSLAINESFESAFREVKQVKKQDWIVLTDWEVCTNILHYIPGVSNRTKSNKNPIELNRTIGVRLGSAIEQNRTSILW